MCIVKVMWLRSNSKKARTEITQLQCPVSLLCWIFTYLFAYRQLQSWEESSYRFILPYTVMCPGGGHKFSTKIITSSNYYYLFANTHNSFSFFFFSFSFFALDQWGVLFGNTARLGIGWSLNSQPERTRALLNGSWNVDMPESTRQHACLFASSKCHQTLFKEVVMKCDYHLLRWIAGV